MTHIYYTRLLWMIAFFCLTAFSLALAQDRLPSDPDPNRFLTEIEAFRAWDSKNSTPDQAILFVGSSSFRMWNTADAFPNHPIINRGFGGSHITDMVFFYKDIIAPYKPALILIYIGDNDIAAGVSGDLFLRRYEDFTTRIWRDNPEVKIGFVSIKPSTSRWNYWPEMHRVNETIREMTSNDLRHLYVDLGKLLLNEEGRPDDTLFLSDHLHLNEEGYKRWTEELTQLLSEL